MDRIEQRWNWLRLWYRGFRRRRARGRAAHGCPFGHYFLAESTCLSAYLIGNFSLIRVLFSVLECDIGKGFKSGLQVVPKLDALPTRNRPNDGRGLHHVGFEGTVALFGTRSGRMRYQHVC